MSKHLKAAGIALGILVAGGALGAGWIGFSNWLHANDYSWWWGVTPIYLLLGLGMYSHNISKEAEE